MNFKNVAVTAKDRDGSVIGTGSVRQYGVNQAGLDQAVKDTSVKLVVTTLNRQIKTDCRNTLARPVNPATVLSKMGKADPAVQKRIEALLAELA